MNAKWMALGTLLTFLAIFAYSAYSLSPSQCAFYTEGACESNNCFWCDGCVNNELGSSFGADKCVQSSLNCTYSCSLRCGAQCVTNTDCQGNITGDICYFDGICNSCSCIYKQDDCPKPGTISAENRLCYYETRSCGTNGCSVQSCQLQEGDACDPDTGCVYTSGHNNIEDYSCKGNELHAKLISYFCNSTECFYSKNDALVERCSNGCNNGKCNEAYCNVYGIKTLCSLRNGFYGDRFCMGSNVYQNYRTYRCGTNECVFDDDARKVANCAECQAGRCVDPGQIIYVNYSRPNYTKIQPDVAHNVSFNLTPSHNIAPSGLQNRGGRVFNGLLFGSNEISIPITGNGQINFTVKQTNRLGALVVQADNKIILEGNVAPDTYIVPFNASRIHIYTRSSGWFFFTPAVYDIRAITIIYV